MSTMNSEIYAALIEAGSSEEKAKAAALSVTDYERNINEVKPDLKVIKWGIGLIMARYNRFWGGLETMAFA